MEYQYDGAMEHIPVEHIDEASNILLYGQIDPNAEYLETQCILADGGDRFGVSALAFDPQEELLWMGNQGGHVTSYYGAAIHKHTSFQVHATEEIRHISVIDAGILALSISTLRCQMRRGIPIFTHTSSNMIDMQCMLQLSQTRLLLGGHQDKLIDFDLNTAKETSLAEAGQSGCALLRTHNRFICAGDPVGKITLRDPNSLSVEHTLESHTGSLSDFDVQGNLLVTCGFSGRQGNITVDRFLMVYDLRMLRAVSPIQVVVDPLYLRFLPSVSSRLAVVTHYGQIQLADTVTLSEPKLCLYQMNSAGPCLAFDVASTSQAFALGDGTGSIHLFTSAVSGHDTVFNTYSRPTETADPVDTSVPPIGYDDYLTPLSVIPLPLNDGPLASDWPPQFMQKIYRRTPPIDPEILKNMKTNGPYFYAPNPKSVRRNQVPYVLDKRTQTKLFTPEARNLKGNSEDAGFIAIPKRYRKVDVKYTKLAENDYEQYNRTGLPGLEAILPNSYCNPMIQVLYYIEPVRVALLSHTCIKEFCLSCELGFLFHMLDKSNGLPCQPGNFLRAFRTIPEASALGLILSDMQPQAKLRIEFVRLIQSWNRFILHQMHYDIWENRKRKLEEQQKLAATETKPFVYRETDFPSILVANRLRRGGGNNANSGPTNSGAGAATSGQEDFESGDGSKGKDSNNDSKREEDTEISQLFGMKQLHVNKCLKCNQVVMKDSILLVCNLIYPNPNSSENEASFTDLLLRSLKPEQTTQAWCDECGRFTPTSQLRHLQSLPQVLSINCGLENPVDKQFWKKQIDQVVAKVVASSNDRVASSASKAKPCRFGGLCNKPNCKFSHPTPTAKTNTTSPIGVVSHLYYSNAWLPHYMEMKIDHDKKLSIRKLDSANDKSENSENNSKSEQATGKEDSKKRNDLELKRYTLKAVVCYVHDDKRNLVALIRVPPNYRNANCKGDAGQWYLFNDISVTQVTAQEATWFSLDWKIPCVLYYACNDVDMTRTMVMNPLTQDVFGQDKCLARSGGTAGITFTPLSASEMPQPGELVAMDAEFVTLNQEEAELRSDGKVSTIKPSHMSVARITCIRGQGPLEGTPFIDDYISTQEQVVDYLTKFSGIQPGDLDANFSSKHLTTLKSTYQKIRFLLDKGVVFVGHGLQNDFRVINLVVPQEQVLDTVQLFHLPHQRMVSLRFLAWHFLGTKIQSVTHDSTEDARTALQLYHRYEELQSENKLQEALIELYEAGKQYQWRVPDD